MRYLWCCAAVACIAGACLLVSVLLGSLLFSSREPESPEAEPNEETSPLAPTEVRAEPSPPVGSKAERDNGDGDILRGVLGEVDALIPEKEAELQERAEWELHLAGVLEYDRQIAARSDLPPDKLKSTSTEGVASHFFRGTMPGGWFLLYDDPNKGIERALRASATLLELTDREDMVEGIARMYAQTDIEGVLQMADVAERGGVSMSLFYADQFLMYPPVFAKTRGNEKELLALLCDRYRRMSVINRAKPDSPPYSAVFNTTRQLAMMLVRSLAQQGMVTAQRFAIRDEEAFYSALEQFLRSQ